MIRLFTFIAEFTGQALCQDAQHGVGEIEGIHPHFDQSNNRFRGIVGMQGTENPVPGERCPDRGFRCDRVTHLADHDDIRISAQERTQRIFKGKADLGMNLDLPQAVLGDFYRILGRPDLGFRVVDLCQGGMQTGGFTGTGRANTKDDPIGPVQQLFKAFQVAGRKTEFVQFENSRGREHT